MNIQDGPRKEKFADSKVSGYVWTKGEGGGGGGGSVLASRLHKWDIPAVIITFALVQ